MNSDVTIITDHHSYYKSPITPHHTKPHQPSERNQTIMKGPVALAMLAMLVMALAMVHPSEAFNCNDLTGMLAPCMNYLKSGGSPTHECCDGAKKVQGATKTQADRRTACKCAKKAAGQLKVRPDAASSLPGKCGISTSIPIDPSVNCDT
ncbi:hypothetical protein R6Q57_014066 [Mikania cordata]